MVGDLFELYIDPEERRLFAANYSGEIDDIIREFIYPMNERLRRYDRV